MRPGSRKQVVQTNRLQNVAEIVQQTRFVFVSSFVFLFFPKQLKALGSQPR